MSYATRDEVITEFKDFTPSSSTPISNDDIDTFLAEADAEIDSRLSVKYSTPITGSQALIMMRMIEKWIVKDRIEAILQVKSGRPQDQQEGTKSYRQQALDLLDKLVKGELKLTDATLASSADGVQNYAYQNGIEHIFDRSKKQW